MVEGQAILLFLLLLTTLKFWTHATPLSSYHICKRDSVGCLYHTHMLFMILIILLEDALMVFFTALFFKNAEWKWCLCMTGLVWDTEGRNEIVNVIMFYFISICLHYRMPFKFNSPFNWPYPSMYISDWRSCLLSMYIF